MKAKVKLGMGLKNKNLKKKNKKIKNKKKQNKKIKSIRGKVLNFSDLLKKAKKVVVRRKKESLPKIVKHAMVAVKSAKKGKNKKQFKTPGVIPLVRGSALPLIPIFAALSGTYNNFFPPLIP